MVDMRLATQQHGFQTRSISHGSAAHTGPLRPLLQVFAPRETPRVDRRKALALLGGAGAVFATGAGIFDTVQPKSISNVTAPEYQRESATIGDLQRLNGQYAATNGALSWFLSTHQRLFVRQVEIQWKEDHQETYQDCDTDEKGTRHCVTRTRTVTETKYDSRTVMADQDLSSPRLGTVQSIHAGQSHYSQMADLLLNSPHLKEIVGVVNDMNLATLDHEAFARHFGFEWQEEKVGMGWQVFLASVIGIPSTAIFLFYDKIWKYFNSRNRYNDYRYGRRVDDDEGEMRVTRRALLRSVLGAGATAFAVTGADRYRERSDAIKQEGRLSVREDIVESNGLNATQFHDRLFGNPYSEIIAELKNFAAGLRKTDVLEVERSIHEGLRHLDDAERELRMLARGRGGYGITTLRKDNHYQRSDAESYVKLAQDTAVQMEEAAQKLEEFFKDGVPSSLLPAMRAYQITEDVNQNVKTQGQKHLWGLSRDLGILYAGAVGLAAFSELPGPHHQTIYNAVHGIFDYWDRGKLTAYQVILGMQEQYGGSQMDSLMRDRQLNFMAAQRLELLKRAALDYEQAGIVADPRVTEFLGHKKTKDRQRLQDQLKDVTNEKIIQVYIDKAFVFFAKQQLSLKGLVDDVLTNKKAGKDHIVKNPPFADFEVKVLELMRQGESTLIFDLIDAGVIEDNEPNEDWQTAESGELSGYIQYWADRIAGQIAASTNMLVALKVLPASWFIDGQGAKEYLSSEDIKESFMTVVLRKMQIEAEKIKIRKEIEDSQKGRVLDEKEIAQRVLLRDIQKAFSSHQEMKILRENSSKLQQALQAAG